MRNSQTLLPGQAFAVDRLFAPQQAMVAYLSALALPLPTIEYVALDDAFGRILARDAISQAPHPMHDRSTMDGFAVRAADRGARRIVGEVRMGYAPEHGIDAGEAMRIPTGGTVPPGADAVVPFEDVDVFVAAGEAAETIALKDDVAVGDSITPRGSDMRANDVALRAGRRIGGPELGVLATLGIVPVPVYRRPRVGIISTGDELVDPDAALQTGQIRDSNRYAIAGSLRAMGAEPVHLPRARDSVDAVKSAIATATASCDAAILTGGSSVGARDVTPDAIEALAGGTVHVHGLRVKPGKPTVLGSVGTTPVVGLPGNPTSAMLILEAVVAPLVASLVGTTDRIAGREVVAAREFTGRAGWTWFVPAAVVEEGDRNRIVPLELRSAHVSLLSRAAGYVVLGEERPRIGVGERVVLFPFSSGGLY
jgi:molybdopterin molybdotransferase